LFLLCIDSHGHYLDKWLGKKLMTNQTIFRAENIFVPNSTAQLLKKSGFDVLASHDFISLRKMLIIGLHPI
jgi:hypothetical protein